MSSTFRDTSLPLNKRLDDLCRQLTVDEKIDQMGHMAKGVERLGIPPYSWWNECLHGVARNGRATVFPQAINFAATFDPGLLEKIGSAIADEARAKFKLAQEQKNYSRYTGLTFWTPTINIYRDPRWGRGMETYGEDPTLTAVMGRAIVRGLQGNDKKHLKVAACAKHFAVHSGPEGERHTFDPKVNERDLRETYLPAFKALVDEDVEIVMGAYNLVNGVPCNGNHRLLTEILRDEWGFDGHVTSDCWAIDNFHSLSKVTCTELDSVVMSLLAGCDLCCGDVYPKLKEAVAQSLISEADIDRSFRRLARTWLKLGLFDPEESVPWNAVTMDIVGCDAHRSLAREAAAKSCVLLKNDHTVLPLPENLKIAYLVGPGVASVDVLLGNYFGASPRLTTILEGFVGRVNPSCAVEYKLGTQYTQAKVNPVDWISFESSKADVCIAVLGVHPTMEGEEGEAIMSPDIGDRLNIDLPDHQVQMLHKIKKAGAKLVVILTGGGPISCPEVAEFADAILWVGYPGEAGGEGVADVLFGDVLPSGRLPVTWPRDIRDLPAFENYDMRGRTHRYMEVDPLFPFGFGLSYTRFSYSSIETSKKSVRPDDTITVSVKVANTGDLSADEVVQLYSRCEPQAFLTPAQTLLAFKRVRIAAGKTATVKFKVKADDLRLADDSGNRIIPAGRITLIAAGSCPIPRSTALGASKPISATIRIA